MTPMHFGHPEGCRCQGHKKIERDANERDHLQEFDGAYLVIMDKAEE